MLTFLVTFFSIGSSALNVSNKKINYKNYLESDFCLFSILQLYLFPASIFLFLTISVKGLELMTSQMIKIHGQFLLTIFLNGPTQPSFINFSVFSNEHHTIFTTKICEKMFIQYTVPGFEPTTSRTSVSFHT